MAFTTKRTIISNDKAKGVRDEGKTAVGSAVYPGQAIEMAATGLYDEVASSAADYTKKRLMVATELVNNYEGKTVADVYPASAQFSYYIPSPGDEMNLLIKAGEDIDVGDVLTVEGGGSGLFVEAAGTEAKQLVEAMEDSGGALAANALCRCRVL
jgi:hypothetical protein